MARASSSFVPVRSIEFLIARVRSSTVSVPAGPRSDFVFTAMGRLGRLPWWVYAIYEFCAAVPLLILTVPDDDQSVLSDLIPELFRDRPRQKVNARGSHSPTGWRRVWTWSGCGPQSPGSLRSRRKTSRPSCGSCETKSDG